MGPVEQDVPKPRPGPAPPPTERDDVRVEASPVRCPYCHEQVGPEDAGWVACGGCLARHHDACWDEGGACAACGGGRRLVLEPHGEPAARPAAARAPTDDDLAVLVRVGERARALEALRARGLDEPAARAALERLVSIAFSGRAGRGWDEATATYLLQAAGLVGAAALGGLWAAAAGLLGVIAVLLLGGLGLGLAARRETSSHALGGLAALNVGALFAWPVMISLLRIEAGRPSLAIAALTLLAAGLSLGLARVCTRRDEREVKTS